MSELKPDVGRLVDYSVSKRAVIDTASDEITQQKSTYQ